MRLAYLATAPNRSEIWLGGLDDKERVEKILGREFATILLILTVMLALTAALQEKR